MKDEVPHAVHFALMWFLINMLLMLTDLYLLSECASTQDKYMNSMIESVDG